MMIYQGTWRDDRNESKAEIKYLHKNFLICKWKDWESDCRNILEANTWTLTWTSQPSVRGYYNNKTITWNNGRKWHACPKVEAPGNNNTLNF